MEFLKFRSNKVVEMFEYHVSDAVSPEFLEKVSISEVDKKSGSPKEGDWIARNPNNHEDIWLVSKEWFEGNNYVQITDLDYIGRMEFEAAELEDKVSKLRAFLGTDIFSGLDEVRQNLLRDQLSSMEDYLRVLNLRLTLEKEKSNEQP